MPATNAVCVCVTCYIHRPSLSLARSVCIESIKRIGRWAYECVVGNYIVQKPTDAMLALAGFLVGQLTAEQYPTVYWAARFTFTVDAKVLEACKVGRGCTAGQRCPCHSLTVGQASADYRAAACCPMAHAGAAEPPPAGAARARGGH